MRSWLIFQRRTEPQWPAKRKIALWSWNILLYLLACLCLGVLSLVLAPGPYPLELCRGYWETPLLLVLNLLPALGLGLLLYGAIGRAPWAFLGTAAVCLGLSVGNYFKLAFRDDPVMFGDLLILREAGAMAAKYHPYWDRTMILTACCVVVGVVVLWLLAKGKPRWKMRLCLGLCGVAVLVGMMPAMLSESLYEKDADFDYVEDRWSPTEQFISHGFLYPFLHSISTTVELPPEGYSQKQAESLLASYTEEDIPADQKVNIISIMLEAYNDFTKFDSPVLAQDIYGVWHQLEAEGCSGDLVTNIFGGGTIDTERAYLTGFSALREIRRPVNAYPWYFQQQGYTVEGLHPSAQWFYNRQNVNENLGFSNYYFMENYFSGMTHWSTAGDDLFFPALLEKYQAAKETGKPYFNFSVTYQGHGPYSQDTFYWPGAPEDYVVDQGYSQEELFMLANYFASIYDTNENLKTFTDALRQDETPVVLVLFGDHNPSLGEGTSLYERLGINLDQSTQEGFLNYYATRYIIWANDAAKEVLGNDFSGEGPVLSPCFLMNQVFELCGWTGPAYLQALDDIRVSLPVISETGRYLVDGALVSELPPAQQACLTDYETVQYYWRKHFAYGKE